MPISKKTKLTSPCTPSRKNKQALYDLDATNEEEPTLKIRETTEIELKRKNESPPKAQPVDRINRNLKEIFAEKSSRNKKIKSSGYFAQQISRPQLKKGHEIKSFGGNLEKQNY